VLILHVLWVRCRGRRWRWGAERDVVITVLRWATSPPPLPLICLYSHESISPEKTSWRTESLWIRFVLCSIPPVITSGVTNYHSAATTDMTWRWVRILILTICIMVLSKKAMLFWVVTPCRLVSRYQRFGETYCLHLKPWRWRQYVSPKCWHLRTSLHGAKIEKNIT
jgi:hypothetical protein